MDELKTALKEEPPMASLASPAKTQALLDAYGLSTKYRLGQNFLVNDAVLKKISRLAALTRNDCVLEIGPGIGTLTRALLACAGSVVSVEYDDDLIPVLHDTLSPFGERFCLLHMDALDLTSGDLRQTGMMPNKLVANLPYAVAATVLLQLFQQCDSIESATVMVQKEVADRMKAVPGTKNYGAYSVKLGLIAGVQGSFAVAPGNFLPAPRVESAVVRLDRRPLFNDEGRVCDGTLVRAASVMADAAFATRRKTIANSCKTYFSGCEARVLGEDGTERSFGRETVKRLPSLFQAAGIDARRRGETLSLAEFIRLGEALLRI